MGSAKHQARMRRARKSRAKMRELKKNRLIVYRSGSHIYAQVVQAGSEAKVLCSASTLDKAVKAEMGEKHMGNVAAARVVGKHIGERAKQAGLVNLVFDRAGYPYHGRVRALAEAAREYIDF